MEETVRWPGSRSGAPVEAVARGECSAEAVGGGPDVGQSEAPGCAGRKTLKPSGRRPVVEHLCRNHGVSQRRACRVCRLNRGTYRYHSHQDPRTALRMRIREIAQARVRYGYRKILALLNGEGWKVGRYLVYRLYGEEGLTLRQRLRRRRRVAVHRRERQKPTGPNQVWSLDFVADQLADGRRCVHPRVPGDRGRAELERRGRREGVKPDQGAARSTEDAVLR